MPVNLTAPDAAELHPVAGVRIGVAMAGVRKANRRTWWSSSSPRARRWPASSRRTASALRRCRCAASTWPPGAGIRALVINTGNANAGTGDDGLARARSDLRRAGAAARPGARAGAAVFHRRDHGDAAGRAHRGRPAGGAGRPASADHWLRRGRRHHDHRHLPKAASRQVTIGGKTVTVTGIAKGAGMIRPNMATMLGFVATDAVIAPALMQGWCARPPTAASTASPSTATPAPTTRSC